MKTAGSFKVVLPGEGHTLVVNGGRYTIKASSEDTGGAYTLIEMFLPPSSGPPAHLHEREEESFYILEGTLLFQVGDESLTAGAGAYVIAPRGVRHAFKNVGTAPARVPAAGDPGGVGKIFRRDWPASRGNPLGPDNPGKGQRDCPQIWHHFAEQ